MWKHPASHGQCVDCSRHSTHMEHCNHIFIMPDAWLGGSSCSWPHLQSYRWSLCTDWADVLMISPLPPRRSNSPQTQQSIRILTSLQSAAGPSTEQARRPGLIGKHYLIANLIKDPIVLPACIEHLSNPNIIIVDRSEFNGGRRLSEFLSVGLKMWRFTKPNEFVCNMQSFAVAGKTLDGARWQ